MTLEFEKGKYKKIKIYPDSDPTELAFNFCKVNNFDFSTMKYINSEIQNLLSKFKSNSNLEEFTNNSIQEVEEENAMTDKTLNSIERSKEELLKKDILYKKNKNELIEKEKEISSQDFKYSNINSNKKNKDNNNINKIKNEKEIQNINKEKDNNYKIKNNDNNINNLIKEENNEEKLNNNQSITVSNQNTMKIENAYITNSVRTNKDPKTSADSNLISNTSSCDSPKGKNDRLPSLEEIKELSQDKILYKEKFLEPINNISMTQRSVKNYNCNNFDKLSKISKNNNKCFTDESNNNSLINNNNNFNFYPI